MSFFSPLFGKSPKPDPAAAAQPSQPVAWALAQVTNTDDSVSVFRYRQGKPADWKSVPLAEEVSITWQYANALPDQAAGDEMGEFEEALDDLVDAPDSRLVLVMTGQGKREWCYYARDYGAFMAALNKGLAGKPRFPIDIVHSHDPEWKYWHAFTDSLFEQP